MRCYRSRLVFYCYS